MFGAFRSMPGTVTAEEPLSYVCCSVSVAPLRREPSHRAEQTSQLLFGERAGVLQINTDTGWAQIRCAWDGYVGWCKTGQLHAISAKDFRKEARIISTTHQGIVHMEQGVLRIPLGGELTGLKKGWLPVGENAGKFKGKKKDLRRVTGSPVDLLEAACSYMHAPYQWGGRTGAGIDCSGLVQMAFKLCGVAVLRDADQQATLGTEVHFLAQAIKGDIAFFDNPEGRIVHVGILEDSRTIIHATDISGRVVEDRIDNAGIISVTFRKRTHRLRTIRRISL